MKKNNYQNILLIKHGAFGDLIQCDGALRAIRDLYRDANITLLTTPPFESLMTRCPHIDELIVDPRVSLWKLSQQFKLIKQLRDKHYQLIIDLQNSDRTRLYQKLVSRRCDWSGSIPNMKPRSGLEGLAIQLEELGIARKNVFAPDIKWMADDVTNLLAANQVNKSYIVLIPGCSAKHPEKRWTYYAQLASSLIDKGYDVINIIGPEEEELALSLPGHTKLKKNGYLTWFELAGVLNQAHFIIGNDTGPSHIASCLRKPGYALFGPHTSAIRAEISRDNFQAIEVEDLSELSAETVLEYILASELLVDN